MNNKSLRIGIPSGFGTHMDLPGSLSDADQHAISTPVSLLPTPATPGVAATWRPDSGQS